MSYSAFFTEMLNSGMQWGNYLYGINMTKDIGNTTNPKYLRM